MTNFETALAAIEQRFQDFSVFAVDLHRTEWAAIKQEIERLRASGPGSKEWTPADLSVAAWQSKPSTF